MITAQELYYKSIEQQMTHRKTWEQISQERKYEFEAFAYWANELFKEKQNQKEKYANLQTEKLENKS